MASITNSLSNSEYHAVKAYSKSTLDLVHVSPALLQWSKDAPQEKSEAIEKGTAIHCALLEPDEFAAQYIRQPEYDLRSSAGRASAEHFRESMASSGRIIMTASEYDLVCAMRDSVLAHPTARAYLESECKNEHSIFWTDNGLKLKCRPDCMPDAEKFGPLIADVKKISSMEHLVRSIRDFRYYVQSPFYQDGFKALYGELPRFVFIAVSEKRSIGRHEVRCLELHTDWTDKGRDEYQQDLDKVREIEEFGVGNDVEVLGMPSYLR